MASFRLKSGIEFTAEGDKYLVMDTSTRSTFRVGRFEYLILNELKQGTDLEEVVYRLRSESGIALPYDLLNRFIQKAVTLNIVEALGKTRWDRIKTSGPFHLRVTLFDPGPILEGLIRRFGRSRRLWLPILFAVLVGALLVNVTHFRDLWALRSFRMPAYAPVVILFVYFASIGHEMLHGLAAKWYGFDVPEVGFHFHYCLPSFYCKILRSGSARPSHVANVLLAGSVFDLAVIGILVLMWFSGVVADGPKEIIAFAVTLIWLKILLVQLNPLLPFSDGYRIVGLMVSRRRGH